MAPPRTTGPKNPKVAAFMRKAVQYFEAGDLPKAQKNVTKYLSADPGNEDANHLAGLIAMNLGQPEQAFKLIKRALNANPRNAMCHSNLGEAYRALEKLPEAEACYRKAIEIEPTVGGFYNNLGIALAGQEKLSDAIVTYETGLRYSQNDPMILTNLGNARLSAGDHEGAVADHERAIKLNPASVEAHTNLGLAYMARGDTARAQDAFDIVLARQPAHLQAMKSKAEIFELLGELEQGRELRETVITVAPDDRQAYFALADVLRMNDQPEEAIVVLERYVKRTNDPAETLVEIASIHRATGARASAEEILSNVLSRHPRHVKASTLMAQVAKPGTAPSNTKILEDLGEDKSLDDHEQMTVQFALGKVFEDGGDYDRAAKHYIRANAIRHETTEQSQGMWSRQFEQLKTIFDQQRLENSANVGLSDPTPIFIVGMPRSGTSLVEQIIASHSRVRGAGELPTLGQTTDRLFTEANKQYPKDLLSADPNILAEIGETYVSMVRKRFGDARHITDKLPHNFLQVGLIRLALPNAKIIHCQRHPMDTCLSIFKSMFSDAHDYSYDMAELGAYYRQYLDLMEHWRTVVPDAMYEIRYEDMVENTEEEARKLLDHCNLEWESACLEFYKTKRTVNTTSASQVRQPIYKSSVALWKRYGTHLQPLIDALAEAVPSEG